jgi:hypothetical protein
MGLMDLFKKKKAKELSPEAENILKKVADEVFPGGWKQIQAETDHLHRLLGGRLEKDDVRSVLTKSKSLISLTDDKSKARIVPSIINYSKNKLSVQDAGIIYHTLIGYSDKPTITIKASSVEAGLEEQVTWLTKKFGMKDKDWKIEQMIQNRATDGRVYQIADVLLTDGSQNTVVFDVTSYAGKR